MIKRTILITLIISVGILSWGSPLTPAQKTNLMVEGGKLKPWQPPEEYQEAFQLAAMVGPVEKRTHVYTSTKASKSSGARGAGSPPPKKQNQPPKKEPKGEAPKRPAKPGGQR
jgi:hypothetical protein